MNLSFSDYLDSYMQFCRVEKLLTANTIESYERDLRSLEQYLNESGITSLENVNSNDLIDYLEWLQNVKLLDNSSISRHRVSMRQLFKYLFEEELLSTNPSAKISGPRTKLSIPSVITKEQVDLSNTTGLCFLHSFFAFSCFFFEQTTLNKANS